MVKIHELDQGNEEVYSAHLLSMFYRFHKAAEDEVSERCKLRNCKVIFHSVSRWILDNGWIGWNWICMRRREHITSMFQRYLKHVLYVVFISWILEARLF